MRCPGCQALDDELARLQRVLGRSRDRDVVAFFSACVRDLEGRVRAHELVHAARCFAQVHEPMTRVAAARAEQISIDRRG